MATIATTVATKTSIAGRKVFSNDFSNASNGSHGNQHLQDIFSLPQWHVSTFTKKPLTFSPTTYKKLFTTMADPLAKLSIKAQTKQTRYIYVKTFCFLCIYRFVLKCWLR